MIFAQSLSYKLDQRFNKLSTNEHQQIPVEDKVLVLNEAQIKLVKTKLGGNNVYRVGFDGMKKRYQDLQSLVENFEKHPLAPTLSDKILNKWIADISDIKPKMMFYVDSYLLADKGECLNRVIYANTELIKHGDITFLLQNSNFKPSFEYQETIADISSNELHYYTDGTFDITKAYLSYIRYPQAIDLEGYVRFDGTESTTIDSELEDYLEDELLDLAVELLAMYTENPSAVAYAKQRQQENE